MIANLLIQVIQTLFNVMPLECLV